MEIRGGAVGSTWRRSAPAGFTIIELMIALALMGLIAAITYARVGPALTRAQVRGASNVLATDLQYAQLLAARFGEPMVITVDATAKEYEIAERDGDSVYRLRRFGSNGEFRLTEFSASPATLQMFPNAILAQAATFTLGNDDVRKRVTISQAGRIRIENVP